MNIAPLDWAVIVVYFIVITAIGLVVGYRVRRTGDFFLGGRRFGPWLMIGQSFGVGTHAEMPVALAGAVYTMGASGIWFQWKNLFITPFYWLMAPVFRRIRRTTMAEFTEDRYGSWMGAIYIVFALCYFVLNMGSMLKGAGKVIGQASGGSVGANEIVVAMTVMFILYSFVGGLVAAAWTDLFQGLLIIVLSFMLIPLGWSVVGGLDGMKASLEPFRFSLATPSGIGPWVIAMLTVNGLVGIMAQPHQLAAVGTGRDEHTCRVGMFYGNFVKRVCTVGWALVGLIVAAMVAQGKGDAALLSDPENAFGFACRQLLFPGALGLMIAVGPGREHVDVLGVPGRQRRDVYRRAVPATAGAEPPGPSLSLGRADQRPGHHDARRVVRAVPDSERAVLVSADRDARDLCRHQRAGWCRVAARQSMGGAGEPVERAGDELPLVLSDRRTTGPLGRQCVPGIARGRDCGPGRREPAHAPRAGGQDRVVFRAAADVERRGRSQSKDHELTRSPSPDPLLLVNLLRLRQGAAGRGWRAYRDDLGGFAIGWVLVIVLVIATVMFL